VEVRTEMQNETQGSHVIKISVRDTGRGCHSSTYRLNLSRFAQCNHKTCPAKVHGLIRHVDDCKPLYTGIGIPGSAQSKLFSRFSQAGRVLRAGTRRTLRLLPPPHPHACMSIYPEGKSCCDFDRGLVRNDQAIRWTAARRATTAGRDSAGRC